MTSTYRMYVYIIQQSKWFSQSNLLINMQMRIVCIFSFLYFKRQTTSDTDTERFRYCI